MRDMNERVVYLERRMDDHAALMADIRGEMRELRSDLRSEMSALRVSVEGGFSRLDHRIDRYFMWLVGIVLTALTAVFAAFVGVTYR